MFCYARTMAFMRLGKGLKLQGKFLYFDVAVHSIFLTSTPATSECDNHTELLHLSAFVTICTYPAHVQTAYICLCISQSIQRTVEAF